MIPVFWDMKLCRLVHNQSKQSWPTLKIEPLPPAKYWHHFLTLHSFITQKTETFMNGALKTQTLA